MKTTILLLITLFIVPASLRAQHQAVESDNSAFIGYKYKGLLVDETLPNGWKDQGGALITNADSAQTYAVSNWRKGTGQMLWLKLALSQDQTGITEWEVKDALVFPNLPKNQSLDWAGIACHRKKQTESMLIVLTKFAPRSKTYQVLRAWDANPRTEKFEKISIKGIECAYEEP